MARPTIYDQPMTAAERMRRYRARKHAPPPQLTPAELRFVTMPKRLHARLMRCSERHLYHHTALQKYRLIKWDDDVLNSKYGHVGIEFLAEVCQYGDADSQRAVHKRIKQAGAVAGRALWQLLIEAAGHEELIRKHRRRRQQRFDNRYADFVIGMRRSPESSRVEKDAAKPPIRNG